MIETKALAPSTRAGGRWSNFSISGKRMSTCGAFWRSRSASSSGRRCSVCGPNTTSTKGARRMISSPSWLATQPPTPISTPFCFRCLTRPRSENTFSCAFSRTEQVLKRIRSACSGSSVGSYPSAAFMTSAILSESYSFIWQPKVLMKTLRAMAGLQECGAAAQGASAREDDGRGGGAGGAARQGVSRRRAFRWGRWRAPASRPAGAWSRTA